MKIVAFVVRLECEHCKGKGWVPGGQREYGELIRCPVCNGRKTVDGEVDFKDFAQLVTSMVKLRSK